MRPSLQSKILSLVFKLINFKKKVEEKAYKQNPKSKKLFVPRSIIRNYKTDIQSINSKTIATFERKENVTINHIISFHGGAYIFEISSSHWKLAKNIVDKSSCRMSLIDYPLAPEFSYKQTLNMVQRAYNLLLTKYPDDIFIFMGDSSGGGLALAFIQRLIQENNKNIPAKCILISPWLDLTLSNSNISQLEISDHILSIGMLKYAAEKYSNGDNLENYLLSPINGIFENIPKTIIFYGTEELFNADCNKLKAMIDDNSIIFREYERMQHVWPLFPIPERELVLDEICDFIYE